jgi:hypothetical protein
VKLAALLLLGGVWLSAAEAPLPALTTATIDGEVLHANTLEVVGLAFRDVTARPRYADGRLGFLDIEAKAYRGRINGWYTIELRGDKRSQRCEFRVSGIDLATLARSQGATNEQLAGRIEGWFEMNIPIGEAGGITGRGQIDITDGTLVQLPLLVNFLAGNPAGARGKDKLSARFLLRDNGIDILWLRLESPVIQLAAQGHIGYDGKLQIEIAPRLPFDLLSKIPLLGGWAASGLSRLAGRVTRAYVRGHVSQPVIVIDAFGK